MPIKFHPRAGQILMCDFDKGFRKPELVKKRPVIVLTPPMQGRASLTTVVGLSSVRPEPICKYHYLLPQASLPMLSNFQETESWVKGDMIYTIGFHRLNLIRLGTRRLDTKRNYFTNRLSRQQMREVYSCLLHGLNLGVLAKHLPE